MRVSMPYLSPDSLLSKFHTVVDCEHYFVLFCFVVFFRRGGQSLLLFKGRAECRSCTSYLKLIKCKSAGAVYLLNVVSLIFIVEAKDLDYLYDILLVDLLWGMRNLVSQIGSNYDVATVFSLCGLSFSFCDRKCFTSVLVIDGTT